MVCNNSASNYGPYRINILSVTLLILSLTSVCSVKVPHSTGSVDPAQRALSQGNILKILTMKFQAIILK